MPKVFKSVAKHEDDLMAEIAGKGWLKVVSINDVSGTRLLILATEMNPTDWDVKFNDNLLSLLHMAEGRIDGDIEVVYETADGTTESQTFPLYCPQVYEGVKKNFEGIVAVGKAAGLTETDLAAIFAGTLGTLGEDDKAQPFLDVNMNDMMQHMDANNMECPAQ